MTIETDKQRADLRALIDFPAIRLPDYSADPAVLRRVGRILAKTTTHPGKPPMGAKV